VLAPVAPKEKLADGVDEAAVEGADAELVDVVNVNPDAPLVGAADGALPDAPAAAVLPKEIDGVLVEFVFAPVADGMLKPVPVAAVGAADACFRPPKRFPAAGTVALLAAPPNVLWVGAAAAGASAGFVAVEDVLEARPVPWPPKLKPPENPNPVLLLLL